MKNLMNNQDLKDLLKLLWTDKEYFVYLAVTTVVSGLLSLLFPLGFVIII